MKIVEVETKIIETAFLESFHTTYGKLDPMLPHVIVKITTDSGLSGLGEASPLPFFTGETVETTKLVIDKTLGSAIIGENVFNNMKIHQNLDRSLSKNSTAKSAIDMALWDLRGKALNMPVYNLLGGDPNKLINVAYVLGDEPIDRMVEMAKEKIRLGISTLKIKIGTNPKKDIEAIQAVRNAVGPDIHIRIDANQGYNEKTALMVLNEIRNHSVDYIEQPVPAWDIDSLSRIRKKSPIPVMADESLHSTHDAINLIKAEAVDIFGIKFIKCGGITPAIEIAHIAKSAGVDCVAISTFDTWLWTYAYLHLATILSEKYAHELVGPYLLDNDPFGETLNCGKISFVDGPGLGIDKEFDSIK